MNELKIGNRVEVTCPEVDGKPLLGEVGTIINISKWGLVSIEFDNNIGGHSCGGEGRRGYCWWLRTKHLKKLKKLQWTQRKK